jgi:hypothetical protein
MNWGTVIFIACWAAIVFAFGVLVGAAYGVTSERRHRRLMDEMKQAAMRPHFKHMDSGL